MERDVEIPVVDRPVEGRLKDAASEEDDAGMVRQIALACRHQGLLGLFRTVVEREVNIVGEHE
jgi:hypothetical protein